jgi:methionyl-tRNA synthetase
MSKTLGNVVDPVEVARTYGAEALRYYLLRESPAAEDGDFTLERFLRAYDGDLADQLGNLLNRTVSMIGRYYGDIVPEPASDERPEADRQLIATAQGLCERIATAMERFDPQAALVAIWELVGLANKYVGDVAPWALARRRATDPSAESRLATALYTLAETLRLVAEACHPFLPATAEGIARQLGVALAPDGDWSTALGWGRYPAGTRVQPGPVLFPKLDAPVAPAVP